MKNSIKKIISRQIFLVLGLLAMISNVQLVGMNSDPDDFTLFSHPSMNTLVATTLQTASPELDEAGIDPHQEGLELNQPDDNPLNRVQFTVNFVPAALVNPQQRASFFSVHRIGQIVGQITASGALAAVAGPAAMVTPLFVAINTTLNAAIEQVMNYNMNNSMSERIAQMLQNVSINVGVQSVIDGVAGAPIASLVNQLVNYFQTADPSTPLHLIYRYNAQDQNFAMTHPVAQAVTTTTVQTAADTGTDLAVNAGTNFAAPLFNFMMQGFAPR